MPKHSRSRSLKSKKPKSMKPKSMKSKHAKNSKSGKKSKMAKDHARCMSCQVAVKPVNTKEKKMKNGRPSLTGNCPKCGGKVFRFL